jgi:hypothetical protein
LIDTALSVLVLISIGSLAILIAALPWLILGGD